MEPEYHSDGIPEKLVAQLKAGQDGRCFRRRAVLAKASTQWELVCCTIERLAPGAAPFEPTPSRSYPQAMLYEDLLTELECLDFATEVQAARGRIGECDLAHTPTQQWQTQLVPVRNDYMRSAGLVVGARIGQSSTRPTARSLLVPGEPYYPDIEEAGRDWLPFPIYHGQNDGRNGQIFFLLPETRAFIASAEFSDAGSLIITVAGSEVEALKLLVKGAYWEGGLIRHFEEPVRGLTTSVSVSGDADRLEYYLLDRTGTALDFHREDRFSRSMTGSSILKESQRSLEDQMRHALSKGEGQNVEFKPFVDPDQKRAPGTQKSKFDEIAITVVAFANTEGGQIYLGVNDDCEVPGIEPKLSEWAKASSSESVIARYLGALKSRIKSVVQGELLLQLWHVRINGALVAVMQVSPAHRKPVAIRQDHYLYARVGASNRKVPPDQWRTVLEPRRSRLEL
jgi:hypothetical protein